MIRKSLLNDIVEWHKSTFPDVTLSSQLLKLEEEIKEFQSGYAEEELADILIVSIVLARRFNSEIGNDIFVSYYDWGYTERMERLIADKLEINKKRTWKKVNGVYRHTSE